VVLIGGHEDTAIFFERDVSLRAYSYPLAGKNIKFVLPGVLMRRSAAARLNIKDTHAEVWCSLIGTDDFALDDAR